MSKAYLAKMKAKLEEEEKILEMTKIGNENI